MKKPPSSATQGILTLDQIIVKLENNLGSYLQRNKTNLDKKKVEFQETLIQGLKSSSHDLQFGSPDEPFINGALFRFLKNNIENRDSSITGMQILCQLNKNNPYLPFETQILFTKLK